MFRYVHGSEDSLDLDVFYVFDKMPSFKECQEFCSDKEENRNIIVIENGVVTNCYKGTVDEINNSLIDTYPLHKQDHPNVITGRVERDLLIKMVRVVRCLLSHCSRTQYRSKVKEALRSSSWKFKLDTLKEIDFTSIDDYGKNGSKEDVYKIFAFQLGQVLSLIKGVEVYTKSSIAKEHIGLKKYLYREKDTPLDSILELLNVFIETAKSYEHVEKDGLTTFIKFDKTIDLNKEEYI